jgi:cation:H+ antiporter
VTVALSLIALTVGFAGMIVASRHAVDSATELVAGTRVPPFVIGMTVLAIGTDLPEIANSIVSSWTGHGDLNVGDGLGSAATQTTLVLGLLPLIVGSMVVTARGIASIGWLAVVGIAVVAVVTVDDWFGRTDAALLIALWALGSWFTFRRVRRPHQLTLPEEPSPRGRLVVRTVVALGGVAVAAMISLWALVQLAEEWNAPEFLVSFFLASIGTSLPELAFDITAVRRGEVELAIGDIFGSSFIDATLAIAIGPLLFPVAVTSSEVMPAAVAALIAVAVVTIVITRVREHDWRSGTLFIVLYAAFFLVLL